jgi:hypothetical protein
LRFDTVGRNESDGRSVTAARSIQAPRPKCQASGNPVTDQCCKGLSGCVLQNRAKPKIFTVAIGETGARRGRRRPGTICLSHHQRIRSRMRQVRRSKWEFSGCNTWFFGFRGPRCVTKQLFDGHTPQGLGRLWQDVAHQGVQCQSACSHLLQNQQRRHLLGHGRIAGQCAGAPGLGSGRSSKAKPFRIDGSSPFQDNNSPIETARRVLLGNDTLNCRARTLRQHWRPCRHRTPEHQCDLCHLCASSCRWLGCAQCRHYAAGLFNG